MTTNTFMTVALMMSSAMLSVVFYISWRSFGRGLHALAWCATFVVATMQWVFNILRQLGFMPDFLSYWLLVSGLSYVVASLGLVGYLLRANKMVPLRWFAYAILIAEGITLITALPGGHFGLTVAISPLFTTITASLASWTLLSAPRPKNGAEWGAIVANILFAVTQLTMASIMLLMGPERDPEYFKVFQTVMYLTLPSALVGLGLFMVTVLASDLAEKVKEMSAKEHDRLRARAEKYWETLQDVISVIPDLVAIDDGTGRNVACNDQFAKLLGAKKKDLIGRSILSTIAENAEIFHSVDGKAADPEGNVVAAGLYRALKESQQLTVRMKDGRTFLVDCAPVQAGGNILLARDVTEVLHTKTQLDDAIASMPMAFAFFDAEGQMIACNSGMERLHESDRAWVTAQSMESLLYDLMTRLKSVNGVPSDIQEGWHEAGIIEALRSGYTSFLGELNDGSWYQISSRRVASGGFVVTAHDVTERRHMEMTLEKNEAQLREVLKGQPFPILIMRNDDACIQFASLAAERVLGVGRNELIGAKAEKFMGAENVTQLLGKGSKLSDASFKRADGSPFPVLYSCLTVLYQGQDATVMSFIDVSDKAALEAELKSQREALFQSEKLNALGTLLAGVAHELNNPLTVVVANAHVLSMTSEDPSLSARVEKITDAAERCSRIVRTFLAMARKGQGERRRFHLTDCIDNARGICGYGFKKHDVGLEVDVTPDLPALVGDADQFSQLFINLMLNSQQALAGVDGERKVKISAHHDRARGQIVVEVADTGPGIPEDVKPKVFDPFFTTKQVGDGTGLGLFLVRGTMRAHDGSINLMPGPDGYPGACFRLELPVGDDKVAVVEDTVEPGPVSGQSVLIVDDEPEILEVLSDILEAAGNKVRAAASATAAMSLLDAQAFDLVISDIRMPDVSGQELYASIKDKHPGLAARTGFMTGDNLSEDACTFLEESGRPVLNKPFSPADVQALVARLQKS